jgi:hypothetical protein
MELIDTKIDYFNGQNRYQSLFYFSNTRIQLLFLSHLKPGQKKKEK